MSSATWTPTRAVFQGAGSLAALFHHQWSAPVLAELAETGGARFAVLVNRLGASDGAMRQTLATLIETGRVVRASGYGHPLRPEYLTTPAGEALGARCAPLLEQLRAWDVEQFALRKWSMPILFAVFCGASRYSEIRRSIPGITDRATALALRDLKQAGLLQRIVLDGYPPGTEYVVTERSGNLRRGLLAAAEAART